MPERLRRFAKTDIWKIGAGPLGRPHRIAVESMQFLILLGKGLRDGRVGLWADSLTLATLVSIIPVLAVTFAVAGSVAGAEGLRDALRTFALDHLAVALSDAASTRIDGLVRDVSFGAVGLFGAAILTLTALRLVAVIERAFDEMWEVADRRGVLHRLGLHFGLVLVGPLFLGLSLAGVAAMQAWMGGWLRSERTWAFAAIPLAIDVLGITILYWLVPNSSVRVSAALRGGIVAGISFSVAKLAYVAVVRHLFRYDVLYGSLGAVPILILWILVGWSIILFGCKLAYATQNFHSLRERQEALAFDDRERDDGRRRLWMELGRRSEPWPAPAALAIELGLPVGFVRSELERARPPASEGDS